MAKLADNQAELDRKEAAPKATKGPRVDAEIELYRNLVAIPEHFEDGFGGKTIVAALFLGFIMVPASIYLSLFMGAGLGPASQWVTVILFSEMVKRSMKSLRQQEIFILFYMTGIVVGGSGGGLLWNQYFVQSPAASGMGIAADIPAWVAPQREILQQYGRTFFTPHWVTPILFMCGTMLLSRIDTFGLGYALYRITAHVEKLPFPMAPVGALGVTALAEDKNNPQRWRWRCFSLGSMLGLAWGFIYVGVPAISGAFFSSSVQIVPIPWLDLTPALCKENFLPATPLNLVLDLFLVVAGMAVPFWAVVGGFLGFLSALVINPMLYHNGLLPTWRPGMGVVDTGLSNYLDFYLSFGMGLMLAIFLVSFLPLVKTIVKLVPGLGGSASAERFTWARISATLRDRNPLRGDLSILMSLGIYLFTTASYILICLWMMPGTAAHGYHDRFPWMFFLGFSLIYQPIISYVNAKLAGMVGQTVQIPLVQEAAYVLSGFSGAAIWFAPIPTSDYGGAANSFRTMELTGTRLTSVIKTEILVFPILIVTTLLFSQLIWRLAPIPSEAYPYAKEVWHQQAFYRSLQVTATLDGSSQFLEAIKPMIVLTGGAIGLAAFGLLSFLNLPTFMIYGFVSSIGNATPGVVVPMMVGALLAKFYFVPRFGAETFKKYAMILLAGFSAGVGLIGMAAVAINLIVKSTTTLGY